MFEKLYKTSLSALVGLMLTSFFARGWSTLCTKAAVRLYYGARSSWGKIYILSDMKMNQAIAELITDTSYDVVDEPESIVYLTPQECVMNKCNPDMIISQDASFFLANSLNYPLGRFDMTTIGYASLGNTTVSEDHSIIGLDIWDERVMFAVPRNTNNKLFAAMVVKRILTDELFRKKLAVEERTKQMAKAKKRRQEKTEQMRKKAEVYGRFSKLQKAKGVETGG